jgi:hypothetical protein
MTENLIDMETGEAPGLTRDEIARTSPQSGDFWSAPTLEELAAAQGVVPLTDVSRLFGTWPGTGDDGFEDAVRALRQHEPARKNSV